jgi:chitinase
MLATVQDALVATHRQLGAVYGAGLTPTKRWGKLGVTVMIGQNDVRGERFTAADARALRTFASEHRLARVSTWSLNRDVQCGATFPIVGTVSNLCSGVRQGELQFARTFAGLRGTARGKAAVVTPSAALPAATGALEDDPAKSPYPVWQPEQAYREGYKVVWHQAVYVARFYSVGNTPDAEDVAPGTAPWRLIGPVLSTDRAPVIEKLPAGTHPAWSHTKVFRAGEKALYEGLPYQAKWYTQGDVPGETGDNGAPSPWKALFRIPGEPYDG